MLPKAQFIITCYLVYKLYIVGKKELVQKLAVLKYTVAKETFNKEL